jgi:valyl-tRNA synthetase
MNEKLLKPYDPKETEERIYKTWEESGFFNPDNLPETHKTPFTIIMPPPNANGRLHAGHALFITLEDIITRYKRMRAYKALWVPGADHAGFETQIVYEKKLEKEGRTRFGMDPQQLYKEIYDFTIENKKYMEADVRRLGASCDWSRERFTLDPDIVKEVQITFKKLSDDNLIYRGKRIVNWCSKHQTSLSDVETENKEKKDAFYYFKYGPFTIGTARPETKFGDKYVVMHPNDKRYEEYKEGQKIELEWINGPITATVIKDEAIDMEFGTGVMTITPWHDKTDFEIAERHGLDKEQIIDFKGKLLPIAGEFAGMKIAEARPKIVEKLKEKGLLVKVDEEYIHNVPCCYKCSTPIEPQIKDQWFVKMKPLAEKALRAVNENKISFIPDNFRKIFLYWMENTLDWNISRQIVWGIPIPAKLCTKCDFAAVDLENTISICPRCRSEVIRDPDTFDTWFSSGQWPLLALGYRNNSDDWKTYYPTDIMETGYDLIFKWVPRMVIFGLYLENKVPFHTVYLHGLVNDAQGKKMSKSKGNVVSPIDIADKFGTDALRMGLVVGNAPGTDVSLVENKIKGYKHFANKIWNATRFILENSKGRNIDISNASQFNSGLHNTFIKELEGITESVTKDMENHMYHTAAEKLYSYFWHEFADKIIELSKEVFKKSDEKESDSMRWVLLKILDTMLKALHPFMPFVTEEIWTSVLKKEKLLIIEKWPEFK